MNLQKQFAKGGKRVDTARELPKKMKAIVAYAPGDYRFEVVDTPRAGEGEMILKVEACGICAGDVKAFHGAKSFWGGDGNPPYIKAPMIPGHEFVGRVVEIGDKVKGNWKIGDRICPEQIVPCGECMFCKTGRHWMCEKHDLFGFQNNVNGGMAEYVRLTKEALPYLVPADMLFAALVSSGGNRRLPLAALHNRDFIVWTGHSQRRQTLWCSQEQEHWDLE